MQQVERTYTNFLASKDLKSITKAISEDTREIPPIDIALEKVEQIFSVRVFTENDEQELDEFYYHFGRYLTGCHFRTTLDSHIVKVADVVVFSCLEPARLTFLPNGNKNHYPFFRMLHDCLAWTQQKENRIEAFGSPAVLTVLFIVMKDAQWHHVSLQLIRLLRELFHSVFSVTLDDQTQNFLSVFFEIISSENLGVPAVENSLRLVTKSCLTTDYEEDCLVFLKTIFFGGKQEGIISTTVDFVKVRQAFRKNKNLRLSVDAFYERVRNDHESLFANVKDEDEDVIQVYEDLEAVKNFAFCV